MRTALACLFLALVTVAILASRQRTLNELRAGNERLREQLSTPAATSAPDRTAELPPTNSLARLTPQEQTELLRLRGQVQPLRRELQDLSNRLATAKQFKP